MIIAVSSTRRIANMNTLYGKQPIRRTIIDDFHAAALANGGSSEVPPGLRLHYSPDFYAAYVRDPDGNKVAAVCRGFRERQKS
jgi:hypothetical protein